MAVSEGNEPDFGHDLADSRLLQRRIRVGLHHSGYLKMRVGGIVLCGGESRRMGRPKALLPFGLETMLQRVASTLQEQLSPVVVVGAPGQDMPQLDPGLLTVSDPTPGRGPVQGVASGLEALDVVDAAFVCSCDLPLLTSSFVSFLSERASVDSIIVPEIGGRMQPLCAVYPKRAHLALQQMIEDSCFRLTDVTERFPTHVIAEEEFLEVDPELRCFTNVNSVKTYKRALRLAGVN